MEINFENIKNMLKNQCKYDYLKENYRIEMDKVINDYAPRVSKLEFISFETIATFKDFSLIAGPDVVFDLFRFFVNVDFSEVTSWVDELTEHELVVLSYTLENFPFSDDFLLIDFTLTDMLKTIVGKSRLSEGFTRERIRCEETK